ncbi:MAG: ProQ/FinO family protein [Pseudomonadota bacterium]
MQPKRKILTLNFKKNAEDVPSKKAEHNEESKDTDCANQNEADAQESKKDHKKAGKDGKHDKKKCKKKKYYKAPKKKVIKKGPTPPKSRQQRDEETRKVMELLCQRFPECFHASTLKPLKLGIQEDLLAEHFEGMPSKKAIRRALTFYTWRMRYLKTLIAQEHRYDLNGEKSGEVTPHQKEIALKKLEKMKEKQALVAQERKEKSQQEQKTESQGKIARSWQP